MIVYHVDTARRLVPGMLLNLRRDWHESHGLDFALRAILKRQFPIGVSCFGARVLQQPTTVVQRNQQTFEIILEAVRQQFFGELPSRFLSVFAARTPEEARKWSRCIVEGGADCPVYEIEADKGISVEAAILDTAPMPRDKSIDFPAMLYPVAHRYWRSAHPLPACQPLETSSMAHMELAPGSFRKEELLIPLPARVLRELPIP